MFASPNTRRKRKRNPRGIRGKRMNRRESKYLWVMSVSEVCSQSSWFGSDVSISEAVERKVVRRPGASTTEWRKKLRGDRDDVGKIPGKIHEWEGPGNLRLLNYREIIKSIPLFTTSYYRPTTIFGTILRWKTRCNNLTTLAEQFLWFFKFFVHFD